VTEPSTWRNAHQPVAAHSLAEALLDPGRYAHTRGVAQQAARLARATGASRTVRGLLLSAAWVHELDEPWLVARSLRRAGCEPLARVVAHRGAAGDVLAMREGRRLRLEFPEPLGSPALVLELLDIAVLTTDAAGAPGSPAAALRALVEEHGSRSPWVRATVGLVAEISRHSERRALVERVAAGTLV